MIRTAFIYRAAKVQPVGDSVIDDVPVFDVARDPLAQVFEPVGGTSYSRFLVIVNHFKSKGSGPDDGTGQGNSNPQRIAQAEELVRFADAMKQQAGTDKVFLSGDFNSYTREDPLQRLYDAGYTDIGSHESPDEHTYLFDGTVGSLDHVLGNAAAMGVVTGAHVWNLSSVESVALEYSRHNYNATDFYEPSPYRASDHDPLVVGVDLPRRAGGHDHLGVGGVAGALAARPPGRARARRLHPGHRHRRHRRGARVRPPARSRHREQRRRRRDAAAVRDPGPAHAHRALPGHRRDEAVADHDHLHGDAAPTLRTG